MVLFEDSKQKPFIDEVKNPANGMVIARIFSNKEAFQLISKETPKNKNKEFPKEITRKQAKEYLADFVKDNKQLLKKSIVTISYYTDNGLVYNDSVMINNDLDSTKIHQELFRDPKNNKHVESGEYNNELSHRSIYGVSIVAIPLNDTQAAKMKAPQKTKYQFKLTA